jgi:hypothetical protein
MDYSNIVILRNTYVYIHIFQWKQYIPAMFKEQNILFTLTVSSKPNFYFINSLIFIIINFIIIYNQ